MISTIHLLTKEKLKEQLAVLLAVDAATPGQHWTAENFLYDLPDKWELSFFSTSDGQEVSGFVIASSKNETIHIHRLAVGGNFQVRGIGKQLVEVVKSRALNRKVRSITLKVATQNASAILFYHKLGFFISKDEGVNYCMELKLTD
jgi:ribosomal protein S18 acetylase RimI-like enzyme